MSLIPHLKKKLERLRADEHMREIARGALLAFALKIFGAGLAFGFNVVVARLLGAEGSGLFFLALSVTAIGSVIGRVGLDNALLRFTATHATKGEWGKVRSVYSLGMRIAILAAGSLSIIGFVVGPWMAVWVFQKPALAEPLRWMSLSILPYALLNLQAESLKGLKRIRDAMLVQGIGVPLFGLLLIYPLARVAGVEGVTLAYLAAVTLVSLLGIWAWQRAIHVHDALPTPYLFRELWASCRPLLATSVMNRAVLPWMPLFLLGVWASSEDVGVFGAASRVAILVSFMLGTVNNVLAPKFAELYTKGEMEALGRTARRSALLITVLASPLFTILILGGEWVMALFGPGFESGAMVLAIIAVGQLVNAFTGSVGFVLMMSGHERDAWRGLVFSVAVSLGLCVLLIPYWGNIGCAIAVMSGEIVKNVVLTIFCVNRLGIVPIPFFRMSRNKA